MCGLSVAGRPARPCVNHSPVAADDTERPGDVNGNRRKVEREGRRTCGGISIFRRLLLHGPTMPQAAGDSHFDASRSCPAFLRSGALRLGVRSPSVCSFPVVTSFTSTGVHPGGSVTSTFASTARGYGISGTGFSYAGVFPTHTFTASLAVRFSVTVCRVGEKTYVTAYAADFPLGSTGARSSRPFADTGLNCHSWEPPSFFVGSGFESGSSVSLSDGLYPLATANSSTEPAERLLLLPALEEREQVDELVVAELRHHVVRHQRQLRRGDQTRCRPSRRGCRGRWRRGCTTSFAVSLTFSPVNTWPSTVARRYVW